MLKAMIARAIVVIGVLLCCTEAEAHQDTIFPIDGDGTIHRLPAQYQPASLRFVSGAESREVTLTLSGRSVPLPACLSRLLVSDKVFAHGSWYHSGSRLPPYLVLKMPPTIAQSSRGLELMFDLRNAELILNDRSSAAATAQCSAAELDAIPHRFLPTLPRHLRPNNNLEERLNSTQGKGPVDVISISFTGALMIFFVVALLRRRKKARLAVAESEMDLPSARVLRTGQSNRRDDTSES